LGMAELKATVTQPRRARNEVVNLMLAVVDGDEGACC
jgi:hypothetical protein